MSNQHTGSSGSGRKEGHGFVDGDGTHDCPSGFPVKGNASSKLAHMPGGRWYDATIPEVCFATPEDAEDEGYRVTGSASERTWVRGDGSHSCPDGFPIKGNLSSMIAHPPESRYFNTTIPEVCFATDEAARAQGYRISGAAAADAHLDEAQRLSAARQAAPEPAPQPSDSSSAATAEQNVEPASDIAADSDANATTLAAPSAAKSNDGGNLDQPQGIVSEEIAEPIQAAPPAPDSGPASLSSEVRITPGEAGLKTSSITTTGAAQLEPKRRSVRHDGSLDCPADFPIKGIERTKTAVAPSDPGYNATMPDICFESIGDATEEGFRSISNFTAPRTASARSREPTPDATIVVRIKRWWVKRKST
jgi:hypothetical protein